MGTITKRKKRFGVNTEKPRSVVGSDLEKKLRRNQKIRYLRIFFPQETYFKTSCKIQMSMNSGNLDNIIVTELLKLLDQAKNFRNYARTEENFYKILSIFQLQKCLVQKNFSRIQNMSKKGRVFLVPNFGFCQKFVYSIKESEMKIFRRNYLAIKILLLSFAPTNDWSRKGYISKNSSLYVRCGIEEAGIRCNISLAGLRSGTCHICGKPEKSLGSFVSRKKQLFQILVETLARRVKFPILLISPVSVSWENLPLWLSILLKGSLLRAFHNFSFFQSPSNRLVPLISKCFYHSLNYELSFDFKFIIYLQPVQPSLVSIPSIAPSLQFSISTLKHLRSGFYKNPTYFQV